MTFIDKLEDLKMINEIKEVLFSESQIDEMTSRIAAEIDRDYADRNKRLLLL